MLTNPITSLDMVRVCILGESSGLGLFGGKEALLLLGILK
jgi:hypothetical protein